MKPILFCLAAIVFFVPDFAFAETISQTAKQQQTPAEQMPRIGLELMFRLKRPVYAVHDPAGRLFFIEQAGKVFEYKDGELSKTPWFDISGKAFLEYECGLLSIAFHPKYAENGYFYAYYTAKTPSLKSFVVEYHVDPKAKQVDDSSERVLLTQDQRYLVHKGGTLQFGPDGYVYICFGDGGMQRDPHHMGQNPGVFLAKILRIDVTPREGYGIPKDNPFVGKEGFKPEIYAWGLRNPWRYSFDRETGVLYAADVGEALWEEVDIIEKGGNYGWSLREGAHDFRPEPNSPKTIDPIFEYSHNGSAASITGGYVYRGKKIPSLVGWYVFGDYSQGDIYGLKYDGGKVTASGLIVNPKDPTRKAGLRNPSQPSSFGEDIDGELYMIDNNGPVYRIVAEKTETQAAVGR